MFPQEIENESFRIIRSELGPHSFSDGALNVAIRVIHATADFDFCTNLRFHERAVDAGVIALCRGCTVVTDVQMVRVGISSVLLARLGGKAVCAIGDSEVCAEAEVQGMTRAAVALRYSARFMEGGIVAIGNAPTALFEVIRLVREEGLRPALIVGVPVGFVNAAESKEALLSLDVPFITAVGRKGGSTVAAAAVNALLRMAVERAATAQ